MENSSEELFRKSVLSRLDNLEKHMVNVMCGFQDFFKHFQNAREIMLNEDLVKILSMPLQINEKPFKDLMNQISKLEKFNYLSHDLDNLSSFFSEFTYFSRRLRQIEKDLEKLQSEVQKRSIKIYVDGKEMIPGDDTIYIPVNKKKKRK